VLDLYRYLEAGQMNISNLVLSCYHRIGMTDKELLLYLQLSYDAQKGDFFPDLAEVGERMGEKQDTVFQLVQSLISKKVIAIKTQKNAEGKTQDAYDLTLFFQKVAYYFEQVEQQQQQQEKKNDVRELYQRFEKEFSRPLSPIEIETIGMWLNEDKYSVELIQLALREAVLNQAYSLKYIDRILLAWERKNLKTKDQVQKDQLRRREQIQDQTVQEDEQLPEVPLYNWLEPDKNGRG